MIDFSIILCFYNAQSRLEKTLWYLSKLDISDFSCELVLVDNNSTDGGMSLAQQYWHDWGSPFPLVGVLETTPGLSFARKAGVEKAQGNVVVFCDDDNWLSPSFVQSVATDFKRDPNIAVVGARGFCVAGLTNPRWFESVQEFYAVGSKHTEGNFVETVYGAGMSVKRNVLMEYFLLFHNVLSDRKEKELSSGGDTMICLALQWMGYHIYSNPQNTFQHAIPEDRFTPSYVYRLVDAMAKSQLRIEGLRSIVYGVPFPFFKRGIRDFLWVLLYSYCLFLPKRRIRYSVWTRFRIQFWLEIARHRSNLSQYFQKKHWINSHSEVFTKYSKHS